MQSGIQEDELRTWSPGSWSQRPHPVEKLWILGDKPVQSEDLLWLKALIIGDN